MRNHKEEMRSGRRFGDWVVISGRIHRKNGHGCKGYVACVCTACDRKFRVDTANLLNGVSSRCTQCASKARRTAYQKLPVGTRVGEWTIISGPRYSPRKMGDGKVVEVLCRCECGAEKWKEVSEISRGRSLTCKEHSGVDVRITRACPNHEVRRKLMARIYAIVQRCTNPASRGYPDYGGRGIRVCRRWLKDRAAFFEYLVTLPGYDNLNWSIDRIDNDSGYRPDNLRFASQLTQNKNKRNTRDRFSLEACEGLLFWQGG